MASHTTSQPTHQTTQAPSHTPLPFLGLACAVGVSTIYYNQPLLIEMGQSLHAPAGATGFVAVATQIGYAVGLLSFVPLGDVLERRALMMRMYGAVAVALLLVALSRNLTWLILASILAGMLAAVTHIVLPIAPDLVDDKQRGRAIGIVMTGLLLGILLARTFAGWVSHLTGWRYVYVIAAVLNLAFVPLLYRFMPRLPPRQPLTYRAAMLSLWTLTRTQPLLRESSLIGALVFASFSCFWTTLAFLLHTHYNLGAGVAGTFGVVGAAGAFVAPIAGRLADRHGSRWVITAGMAVLASSYLLLWLEEKAPLSLTLHIVALSVGVIILDIGAQMIQIANQTRIFGLDPSARSRLNTVYMTVYFSGAAAGSALSTIAWVHFKWNGVCAQALILVALAALLHATGTRPALNPTPAQSSDAPVPA